MRPWSGSTRVDLAAPPASAWGMAIVLVLSVACGLLQIGIVRPHLWPAGTGAALADDPATSFPLRARPPTLARDGREGAAIDRIAPGSPADQRGVRRGEQLVAIREPSSGLEITLSSADPAERLARWRDAYWLGVRGPVEWRIRGRPEPVALERPAASESGVDGWGRQHVGILIQTAVFTGAAIVLFFLRRNDFTAALAVLALALSAVGGGGPLLGAEREWPFAGALTFFSWMATPVAFPVIALAIMYFPSRARVLTRHPWLHAVPFIAAAPMLLLGGATALYLAGWDGAQRAALWDASHPGFYYASFAAALGISLLALLEGIYRYRVNHDSIERRQIRMAVYTIAPGVLAYALKDGVPIVAQLGGMAVPRYPLLVAALLQAFVLLSAFGLVYAVGAARAFGPRLVLRPRLLMECPRCGTCEDDAVAVCPSDDAPMRSVPRVPRVVDNRYRIEQLLGRGGMGAVYRAADLRLDREVAVKIVRAELLDDAEARSGFCREAQIVARLQHPGIVAVSDFGTLPDGGAYLVMELVGGEDLRRILQREGRIEAARAVQILSSVCNAIEAAHREGVLHRDLKPENILLPDGVDAKVLDFGVAKVLVEQRGDGSGLRPSAPTLLTIEGTIVGTPAYMAPEQLRGALADERTDVFSLGVIAYEMLSGELPFGRGSLAEIALAQTRGVPPMSKGTVAGSIERAIRAALEPDPDRRPASPQAFAHLIAAAAGI